MSFLIDNSLYKEYLVFPTKPFADFNMLLCGTIIGAKIITGNILKYKMQNITSVARENKTDSGKQYLQINLKSQYNNEQEIESFCEFTQLTEQAIREKLGADFQVLNDSVSLYYSQKAYPLIHETENLMRRLIANLLGKKLGAKWIDESLNKSIDNTSIRKAYNRLKNYTGINKDILQQLDFNKLGDCLFKETQDESRKRKIFRKIADAKYVTEINIDELRKLIPRSDWDRHFVQIINCKSEELKNLWKKLYILRCDIAHNKSFDKQKLDETVESAERLKKILISANDKVNDIYFRDEEEKMEFSVNLGNVIDPASDEDLEKKAESGDTGARFRLAQKTWLEGNYDQSIQHFNVLALENDKDSQYRLGEIFEIGQVIQENINKAIEYYQLAAESGDTRAQYRLGRIYEGELKDFRKAERYYREAASNNHVNAQWCLVMLYSDGRSNDKDPEKSLPRDSQKAFKWCLKAGNNGDWKAQLNLADMYKTGDGTNRDVQQAFEWYRKAQSNEADDSRIPFEIGCCYLRGEGVERNVQKAVEWLKRAGNLKSEDACMELAKIYEGGADGIPANNKKAKYWYGIAAEQGNTIAQYNLAELFCSEEKYQDALNWYAKAADKNYPDAQYEISVMYMNGQGVDKSYGIAKEWLEKTVRNRGASDELIRFAQQRLEKIEFGD